MTSNPTLFSSITSSSNLPVIHTDDGSQMHASHIGYISTSNISLPHTYLIPNLTLNFISIGQLCDLGLTVLFSPTSCVVQDPKTGQALGIGHRHGRLHELIHLCIHHLVLPQSRLLLLLLQVPLLLYGILG